MLPELIRIGRFALPSYGLMLVISFVFGIWLASKLAEKKGLDTDNIIYVCFWIIVSAILGARLYYVIINFEEFQDNLTNIFNPFQGDSIGISGLVMYGGVIGAVIASYIFFRIKKLPFLPYADALAPSVAFGVFFTRIGCFLNGCCYGHPTESILGVHFPRASAAGYFQLSVNADLLFPSQIFASIGGLTIGLVVLWTARKKHFDGFQVYLTLLLYSVLRFMIDFTRHYNVDDTFLWLTHNQVVSLILFIACSGLLIKNLNFPKEQEIRKKNKVKGSH